MGDVIDLSSLVNEKREKAFQEAWHFQDGEALDRELPPEDFLVEALGISAPGVTIVGGGGFGGKTMAMQSLALSVASGKPLWGHFPVKRGRVVHLDWEQGPLTTRRYQRLARGMAVRLAELGKDLMVSCLPNAYLDHEDGESAMLRICAGASVCIIDAFRGAFPHAQENDSGVRKYIDMLQRVSVATGCAIIVIAHSRKLSADTDVRSSLRGSGSLFDAAQTVFMLDGQSGKPTQVHNTKDRVVGEIRETFGLRILDIMSHDPDSPDRRWGLEVQYLSPPDLQAAAIQSEPVGNEDAITAERLTTLARRLLNLIPGPETDGVLFSRLMSFARCAVRDVHTVLDDLARHGEVRSEGKGNTAIYWLTGRNGRGREPGEEG